LTLTFPSFNLSKHITLWRSPVLPRPSVWSEPEPLPEADQIHVGHGLVRDLLTSNPVALQSGSCVMLLVTLYQKHN